MSLWVVLTFFKHASCLYSMAPHILTRGRLTQEFADPHARHTGTAAKRPAAAQAELAQVREAATGAERAQAAALAAARAEAEAARQEACAAREALAAAAAAHAVELARMRTEARASFLALWEPCVACIFTWFLPHHLRILPCIRAHRI